MHGCVCESPFHASSHKSAFSDLSLSLSRVAILDSRFLHARNHYLHSWQRRGHLRGPREQLMPEESAHRFFLFLHLSPTSPPPPPSCEWSIRIYIVLTRKGTGKMFVSCNSYKEEQLKENGPFGLEPRRKNRSVQAISFFFFQFRIQKGAEAISRIKFRVGEDPLLSGWNTLFTVFHHRSGWLAAMEWHEFTRWSGNQFHVSRLISHIACVFCFPP